MDLLLVGDPHVTVEELGDSQALLDHVLSIDREIKPKYVVFMGDLHHNHALVRVEVTDFWLRNLARFSLDENGQSRVILLLGNHDRPNDASSTAHALQPYRSVARIITKMEHIGEDVVAAPFYHSKEKFAEDVLNFSVANPIRTLLCHQTFDGSMYENGFYAPDGVDPVLVGVPTVISGHIHTAQKINWAGGTVHYIGSPRWRTVSDANEVKSLSLWDTEKNKEVKSFPMAGVCTPISKAVVSTPDDLDKVPFGEIGSARFHLDATTTSPEMEALVKVCRERFPRAKIRPIATDTKKATHVSESEGVFQALRRFMGGYKPPNGTEIQLLQDMMAKRFSNV